MEREKQKQNTPKSDLNSLTFMHVSDGQSEQMFSHTLFVGITKSQTNIQRSRNQMTSKQFSEAD